MTRVGADVDVDGSSAMVSMIGVDIFYEGVDERVSFACVSGL